MIISVIIPIYNGKRYIADLIKQLEAATLNAGCIDVEVVMVCDNPQEKIEQIQSNIVHVQIINTDVNRGIHGARARGLEFSHGEYVVFMDQDDKIFPQYFQSQIKKIGLKDASVCQVIHDGKAYYNENRKLSACLNKKSMTHNWNYIVTPGQVLIKKEAISRFWKENLLKCNGADDWALWICMLCEDRKMVANNEILFEHVVHKNNTSGNSVEMLESMKEVYQLLKKNEYCKEEDLLGIREIVKEQEQIFIRERDKFFEFYNVLDQWIKIIQSGKSISEYVINRGYKSVMIYGKGRIGERLFDEFMSAGINVSCFVDRNAKHMNSYKGVKVILPEEIYDNVNPIVVSLSKNDSVNVRNMLKKGKQQEIYTISEIIDSFIE